MIYLFSYHCSLPKIERDLCVRFCYRTCEHGVMDAEVVYSGGHRLTFVDEVPVDLLCIFCHFPSRDPQLSTCCGYNMCRSCLDSYKQMINVSQKLLYCPKCCYYDFKAYPNKMSDRDVHNFVVLCSNEKDGCKWHGKLNELHRHREVECHFEKVDCPKGCNALLQRNDVTLHVKSECPWLVINCPHCLVRGEKCFIEGQHLEKCTQLPLSCPNHCGTIINSDESLSVHRGVCPLEVVTCEYTELGCNGHIARKDVEMHNRENASNHLNLAKQELVHSTKKLESSKIQLATVEKGLDALKSTFASSIEEVLSMISLLDHLNSVQEKKEKANLLKQIGLYYKNLMCLQSMQVAPVIIKMNDFAQSKRNNRMWVSFPFLTHTKGYKLCLCVFAAGHKNSGEGQNTVKDHLSVFVAVMEGPHDNQLTWPMEGVIHVHLLNQLDSGTVDLDYSMIINLPNTPLFPLDSIMRVTRGGDGTSKSSMKTPMGLMSAHGIGAQKFIPHKKLTEASPTCQFLKDDCIFFKVEYEKKLPNLDPPFSTCAFNQQGSKPVSQGSHHFYRPPRQQNIASSLKENIPTNFPNMPINHAPRDNGASEEFQQAPKIPEVVTRL